MNIIVHPTTKHTLDATINSLPQSLLISGPRGIGLLTIARWIAGKQRALEIHPQNSKEHIDNQNGTISVEVIRRLYDQTRAKHTTRQVIIIDDAERMSRGAQSAFLKLLEEPNTHIHFILLSHQPQKLLPTIRSRVQQITVYPITPQQSRDFIASLNVTNAVKYTQLQFIAEGLPAELKRLVCDDTYFAARASLISDARDLLQSSRYKKVLIIQKYKTNRDTTMQLLESALQILRRSMSAKPQQALITELEQLLEIKERVSSNYNIPLQLVQFVL